MSASCSAEKEQEKTSLTGVRQADKSSKAGMGRICTCVCEGLADKERTQEKGTERTRGGGNVQPHVNNFTGLRRQFAVRP